MDLSINTINPRKVTLKDGNVMTIAQLTNDHMWIVSRAEYGHPRSYVNYYIGLLRIKGKGTWYSVVMIAKELEQDKSYDEFKLIDGMMEERYNRSIEDNKTIKQ